MEQHQDIFTVVGVPEKHVTTMETYISFKITTRTDRGGDFSQGEYEVRRRYTDFLWLRQRLEDSNQTHLIPPLPEKHTLTRLDRFAPEFLRQRQRALQIFLNRISRHPVLSFNKAFALFLTAKPWELQATKKEGPGLMSRVNDSLQNKTAPLVLGGRRDPEFAAMQDFVAILRENLSSVEKVAAKIAQAQTGHHEGLRELAPLVKDLASSEDDVDLQKSLKQLAASVECSSEGLALLIKSTSDYTMLGLREYILYTACIQDALCRRDAIQVEYENTLQDLRRKKEELQSLGVNYESISSTSSNGSIPTPVPSPAAGAGFFDSLMGKDTEGARRDRVKRLVASISEGARHANTRSDRATCADADLKADMERWHEERKDDVVAVLTGVVGKQVDYHRKCLSSWESTLASFTAMELGKGGSVLLASPSHCVPGASPLTTKQLGDASEETNNVFLDSPKMSDC